MVNIGKILKRSWYILWNYRILWIFGILLALTTGRGGGSSNGGSSSTTQTPNTPTGNFPSIPENAPEWARQLGQWFTQNVQPMFVHPEQYIGTFVMIAVIVFLIGLLISTLAAFVRYPAETAVMRMVDEYEQSGRKVGFRQGWKLGWTRRAFRLWLIDLILAIPALVFVLMILGAGLIIYYSVSATFQVINGAGVVAAIGMTFLSVLLLIVVAIFLHLVRNFFARAAVLEDLSVGAALSSGWAMFKRNWKSAGLMWLVMIGIGFGMGIAGMIAFFVLIPAYLILLIPAAIVAALPALITYGITSIFASGPLGWIITILVALPFFLITLFAPLLLFGGWFNLFESNVWTLTYREIKAMESLATAEVVVEK
jgi:hypothetical protein